MAIKQCSTTGSFQILTEWQKLYHRKHLLVLISSLSNVSGRFPSICPYHCLHYRNHLIHVFTSQHATVPQPLSLPRTKKFALLFLQYVILQTICTGCWTPAVSTAPCFHSRLLGSSGDRQEQGRSDKDVSRHIIQFRRGKQRISCSSSRLFGLKPEDSAVTVAFEAGVHKQHAVCARWSVGCAYFLTQSMDKCEECQPSWLILQKRLLKYRKNMVKKNVRLRYIFVIPTIKTLLSRCSHP